MSESAASARQAKVIRFEYPLAGEAPPEPVWPLEEEPVVASEEAEELRRRMEELEEERETLARQLRERIAAVREEAESAAREGVEQERRHVLEGIAAALQHALAEFEVSRSRYFASIEREAVELALAIAARILHRETQMDPLLLRGAVRVALGRLAEATEVQLVVPAAETALWEETLRMTTNLPVQPVISGDEHLRAGECRLIAAMGSVDLSVGAQLGEIERGFFDLLERRDAGPGASRRTSDAAIA
ncbi:FliH/SctL family protein [Silvibacterium dinghuense]|uniref:Flagellar assembly protein FliH n=1 Tax=Silvibacterium dinghuense TaxID=1560006 RepID=A0A4Q1SEG4_9BACT|nr:FliH/SctL family protein [Silvibacterium dinghuense]RXS95669.1 hypothetical protein ESZ00_14035 [Silvibacterium dinghuense]GGH14811.1 hypothetical protein GCM10011586_35490 [Silvibacterium dinghuense]